MTTANQNWRRYPPPPGRTDSDFAADTLTRKSATGLIILPLGTPILWASKRQSIVATSTMQAELIALHQGTLELTYIRNILIELGLPQAGSPTAIFCDNQPALKFTANSQKVFKHSKHFGIRLKPIAGYIGRGIIKASYVSTGKQLAGFLTKALPAPAHTRACKEIMNDATCTPKTS